MAIFHPASLHHLSACLRLLPSGCNAGIFSLISPFLVTTFSSRLLWVCSELYFQTHETNEYHKLYGQMWCTCITCFCLTYINQQKEYQLDYTCVGLHGYYVSHIMQYRVFTLFHHIITVLTLRIYAQLVEVSVTLYSNNKNIYRQ